MSEQWSPASIGAAARVTADRAREALSFTPWSAAPHSERPVEVIHEDVAEPIDLRAAAFAEGFNEGRHTVELEIAAERDAIARLAESLEALRPESPHELGAMLAETVERLVRQIVGEVTLDTHILHDRAMNAAALIAEDAAPAKMRLHPDDLARLDGADLPVEMIGDSAIAPGTVLLETGEGWIEDGPEVGLEKLRIALDRMGLPR